MQRWRSLSVLVLAVTAVYLYAFPTATIIYAAAVLLHTGLGICWPFSGFSFSCSAAPGARNQLLARVGWLFFLAGGAIGIVLIKIGTAHRYNNWLYTHIALCTIGVLFLAAAWLASR